jgi:hypothetical protein
MPKNRSDPAQWPKAAPTEKDLEKEKTTVPDNRRVSPLHPRTLKFLASRRLLEKEANNTIQGDFGTVSITR